MDSLDGCLQMVEPIEKIDSELCERLTGVAAGEAVVHLLQLLPMASCVTYVVDHVKALACGGADAPSNMPWQTIAEGKEKDKWERIGCQ